MLEKPKGRLSAKEKEHADAVWTFLELTGINEHLTQKDFDTHIMNVAKIHKFRELIDNLYTHSANSHDDMKSIGECLEDTKKCYNNAVADLEQGDNEEEDMLTDMKDEIEQMEGEYQNATKSYKEHIANICEALQEYKFLT